MNAYHPTSTPIAHPLSSNTNLFVHALYTSAVLTDALTFSLPQHQSLQYTLSVLNGQECLFNVISPSHSPHDLLSPPLTPFSPSRPPSVSASSTAKPLPTRASFSLPRRFDFLVAKKKFPQLLADYLMHYVTCSPHTSPFNPVACAPTLSLDPYPTPQNSHRCRSDKNVQRISLPTLPSLAPADSGDTST